MEGIIARPPIRSFLVRHLLYADTPFLCPAIEHTYRMHGSAATTERQRIGAGGGPAARLLLAGSSETGSRGG
jgi:hypothetical protein